MNRLTVVHQRLVSGAALRWWEKALFVFLIPPSLLYGVTNRIRNVFYDLGILSSYRSSLPIVSVGNITVGGTGKTPVVDWLVKQFQDLGKHPAVVSRGYAGEFSGKVGVVSDGQNLLMTAKLCGDEPYLLAKRNPRCLVVVAKKRRDGIQFLEERGEVDVIVLDDGFQHRAVKRDIDVVLLDAKRPLGNGWPLPAGNLREFPQALKRADYLLMTRSKHPEKVQFQGKIIYQSDHQLSDVAVSLAGEIIPLAELTPLKLCAFSGIASPDTFFDSLESKGLSLNKILPFADHAKYDKALVATLSAFAKGTDALITTEKDGVKLAADMFELPCYQVPVDIQIEKSSELFDKIVQRIWSH